MIKPSSSSTSSTALSTPANPSLVGPKTWYRFFTQSTAITSAISLALALVFFIAYNWLYMGKMAKFGLVESGLTLSILAYCVLAYKGLFKLGQQLLLLIASIITGSLLALIGQVYQTGADSWQLFFGWAALIVPWVFIARLPALWLLWLGLINLSFSLYHATNNFWFSNPIFSGLVYSDLTYLIIITAINFLAFTFGLKFADKRNKPLYTANQKTIANQKTTANQQAGILAEETNAPTPKRAYQNSYLAPDQSLHWSFYLLGAVVIFFATHLGLYPVLHTQSLILDSLSLGIWLTIMAFFYWRFLKKQIDVLMLTLLSGSIITVLMTLTTKFIDGYSEVLGLFVLAFMLIGLSAAAVNWLRHLHQKQVQTSATVSPSSHITHDADQVSNTQNVAPSEHLDDPQSKPRPHSKPWYLQLFLAISGLFSGLLVTGFLLVLLNTALDDTLIKLILSTLLLFISFLLFNPQFIRGSSNTAKVDASIKSNTFRSSLAFALSLSAQGFLAVVVFEFFESSVLRVAVFMLLQLLLLAVIKDVLHRFVSAFVALGCLVWLLGYYQLFELWPALLALIATITSLPVSKLPSSPSSFKYQRLYPILKPVSYAATVMLLAVSVLFIAKMPQYLTQTTAEFSFNYSLAQGLLIVVCLYAAHLILNHYQLKLTSKTGLYIALAIICLGIVSIYVSGILATSLVIVMAVANQNRLLLGLGISALVGYIFWYYYQLDSSLLIKSVSLLAVAMVLFTVHKLISGRRFAQSAHSQPHSPTHSVIKDEDLS